MPNVNMNFGSRFYRKPANAHIQFLWGQYKFKMTPGRILLFRSILAALTLLCERWGSVHLKPPFRTLVDNRLSFSLEIVEISASGFLAEPANAYIQF